MSIQNVRGFLPGESALPDEVVTRALVRDVDLGAVVPGEGAGVMALIDNKALGQGDTDEELWKKVGRPFGDHVLLLGLDIKMFYAGPKEAVKHAIYRQNFGFTDIIIGRKHADAPYDDGKDIWDGLAAQRKFDELKGDLQIKPVKVGFAAFYEELGRVGLVDEYGPKGYKQVSISGRDLREKLRAGELPDPRVMRPETARVLIERRESVDGSA